MNNQVGPSDAEGPTAADRSAGVIKVVGTIGDFAGHLAGCAPALLVVIGLPAMLWWISDG